MNPVLVSPRVYRLSVISCALVWIGVGLFLARIGDALVAGRRPSVFEIIVFGLFAVNGVLGLRDLLRAADQLTEPPPSSTPGA